MDELVQRLSAGDHPVEVSLRPEKTALALKKRIDDYALVHLRFTGTRGGTELGVNLNKEDSNWEGADFERGTGRVRLAGKLKLNYVPVKCVADIDLSTLSGTGHLEVLDET
jgi:hypothetical protein